MVINVSSQSGRQCSLPPSLEGSLCELLRTTTVINHQIQTGISENSLVEPATELLKATKDILRVHQTYMMSG